MKSITYFYLKGDSGCRQADELLAGLMKENPRYANLEIHYIEESANMEYCAMMGYFYVPCFFVDGINRHEGRITQEKLKQILDSAME